MDWLESVTVTRCCTHPACASSDLCNVAARGELVDSRCDTGLVALAAALLAALLPLWLLLLLPPGQLLSGVCLLTKEN